MLDLSKLPSFRPLRYLKSRHHKHTHKCIHSFVMTMNQNQEPFTQLCSFAIFCKRLEASSHHDEEIWKVSFTWWSSFIHFYTNLIKSHVVFTTCILHTLHVGNAIYDNLHTLHSNTPSTHHLHELQSGAINRKDSGHLLFTLINTPGAWNFH